MRDHLAAFMLGLIIVFGGWFLLLVIRLDSEAALVVPVVLGLITAVVARRLSALLGAVVGLYAWYALAFAVGQEFGDGWQAYAIVFPILIATGFAGGRALLWLRAASGAAAQA